MAEDREPDFIERLQLADERREANRGRRGIILTLGLTVVGLIVMGWGLMFLWVSIRMHFGRWGRERARNQN